MQVRRQDSLDLYAQFLLETQSAVLIRHERGFAVYRSIDDSTAYLQDIYVQPEFRQAGVGQQLLTQVVRICKQANISTLFGSTDVTANNPTLSALAILQSGFKISHIDGNLIWFKMEI